MSSEPFGQKVAFTERQFVGPFMSIDTYYRYVNHGFFSILE